MGVDINQYRAAIGSFSRNGPFKLPRIFEKNCKSKNNYIMKWIKFFVIFSLGYILLSSELNNLDHQEVARSTCIAKKRQLLSATYQAGGKIIVGRSLNYCKTFYKKEDNDGVHFYAFSKELLHLFELPTLENSSILA